MRQLEIGGPTASAKGPAGSERSAHLRRICTRRLAWKYLNYRQFRPEWRTMHIYGVIVKEPDSMVGARREPLRHVLLERAQRCDPRFG